MLKTIGFSRNTEDVVAVIESNPPCKGIYRISLANVHILHVWKVDVLMENQIVQLFGVDREAIGIVWGGEVDAPMSTKNASLCVHFLPLHRCLSLANVWVDKMPCQQLTPIGSSYSNAGWSGRFNYLP
jgi:hypothetical protein